MRICLVGNDSESAANVKKAMDEYFAEFAVKY